MRMESGCFLEHLDFPLFVDASLGLQTGRVPSSSQGCIRNHPATKSFFYHGFREVILSQEVSFFFLLTNVLSSIE